MNRKTFVSLALVGLFAAEIVFASPAFVDVAPASSIETCVAEVSNNADYSDAGSVQHSVDSKPRSVSGYTVSIKTIVYGENDESVLREYRSHCAINKLDQIRFFKIREAQ